MKLLLDHNLSEALTLLLSKSFPAVHHVRQFGLDAAEDREIWEFAKAQGYIIVTKDADYVSLSSLLGMPPKVVWIQRAYASTELVRTLLLGYREQMESFEQDPQLAVLPIS